jgi:hypothetical protein
VSDTNPTCFFGVGGWEGISEQISGSKSSNTSADATSGGDTSDTSSVDRFLLFLTTRTTPTNAKRVQATAKSPIAGGMSHDILFNTLPELSSACHAMTVLATTGSVASAVELSGGRYETPRMESVVYPLEMKFSMASYISVSESLRPPLEDGSHAVMNPLTEVQDAGMSLAVSSILVVHLTVKNWANESDEITQLQL